MDEIGCGCVGATLGGCPMSRYPVTPGFVNPRIHPWEATPPPQPMDLSMGKAVGKAPLPNFFSTSFVRVKFFPMFSLRNQIII